MSGVQWTGLVIAVVSVITLRVNARNEQKRQQPDPSWFAPQWPEGRSKAERRGDVRQVRVIATRFGGEDR